MQVTRFLLPFFIHRMTNSSHSIRLQYLPASFMTSSRSFSCNWRPTLLVLRPVSFASEITCSHSSLVKKSGISGLGKNVKLIHWTFYTEYPITISLRDAYFSINAQIPLWVATTSRKWHILGFVLLNNWALNSHNLKATLTKSLGRGC